MSDLYANKAIREKAEQLVSQNVHYCVSSLISSIAQPGGRDPSDICEALGISYEDNLSPILEIIDYEEAARNHIINTMDRDDLRSYLTDNAVEFKDDEHEFDIDVDTVEHVDTNELRRLALEHVEAEYNGWEDFCRDQSIEPERSEVCEHWIVDNWFAGKLEAKGHPIARDFLGMTIWGRPTTGQSISLDSVILEIARDCLGLS